MTFIESTKTVWTPIVGSLAGRAHRRGGRPGQDGWAVRQQRGVVAAVVCDGCSAGVASELGAGVGARFVAADLVRRAVVGEPWDELPARTLAALLRTLGALVDGMVIDPTDPQERLDVIAAHALCTVQAVVATSTRVLCFGIGDGLVRIDGHERVLPADDGAPDYPAYALCDDDELRQRARLLVHLDAPARDVRTVTIATDGVAELRALQDRVLVDGTAFGGLPLFERDARFVRNGSLAHKRLLAVAGPTGAATEDDCTFVTLRRDAHEEARDAANDANDANGKPAARGMPCA